MDSQSRPPSRHVIATFSDPSALMEGAASRFVALANQAIADRGRFCCALSGGFTPRPLYALLAKAELDWSRIHFFWSDERCVPPDDPQSNYRMVRESFLDAIAPPAANVHRIHGERDPVQAAADYEETLRRYFDVLPGGEPPSFNLVLLGLGADGHTASLFPGAPELEQTERWAVARYVETLAAWRITLTPAIINTAANVIFIVSGASKAPMLKQVLQAATDQSNTGLPAQWIHPTRGELLWMVDTAAYAL